MTDIATTDDIFYNRSGMDQKRVEGIVEDALHGADDGELFLEYNQSESFVFDDGQLKNASFDTMQGFGLRAIAGETAGYSHASELSEEALKRANATVKAVHAGHGGTMAAAPSPTNRSLYIDDNPLNLVPFATKVKLLSDMDAYARGLDDRIKQVSASLSGEWQAVQILRADGSRAADIRPLVRLNVSVVTGEGERMESGNYGTGGRETYEAYLQKDKKDYQAVFNLAHAYMATNQCLESIEAFNKTLDQKPDYLEAHLHLSTCHNKLGHNFKAEQHFKVWDSRITKNHLKSIH